VTGSTSKDVDVGNGQTMSGGDVQGVSEVGLFLDLSSVMVDSRNMGCAKVPG
jgi:hypothetical protein